MIILKHIHKKLLKRGFTLVELLVVIGIIGILASLIIFQIGRARAKTRDVKRISDISYLKTVMELIYDDEGNYYSQTLYHMPVPQKLAKYLSAPLPPYDPLDNAEYGYTHSLVADEAVGPITGFMLWVELENGSFALKSDGDFDRTLFEPSHSQGRHSETPRLPNDSGTANCPDSNLSNNNCIYDIGAKP